jgi:hypothetical protein
LNINWRKWNRVLHRDLGYIFFGMTVIYALSGIALNHLGDWNPSYDVSRLEVETTAFRSDMSKQAILQFLDEVGEKRNYKSHYSPQPGQLKIFIKNGNAVVNVQSGDAVIEKLKRRPVFYHVNFLHYNPKKLWTWFSDLFCVSLILIAVTGLFILKGKNGITRRGAWLTGVGIIIPFIFLIMYL